MRTRPLEFDIDSGRRCIRRQLRSTTLNADGCGERRTPVTIEVTVDGGEN